jgi:hypothetical protein
MTSRVLTSPCAKSGCVRVQQVGSMERIDPTSREVPAKILYPLLNRNYKQYRQLSRFTIRGDV